MDSPARFAPEIFGREWAGFYIKYRGMCGIVWALQPITLTDSHTGGSSHAN